MKYGDLTLGQIEAYINITAGDSVTVRHVLERKAFMTCHEAWRIQEWQAIRRPDNSWLVLVAPLGIELGLTALPSSAGVTYKDVCARARSMGLLLCTDNTIDCVEKMCDLDFVTFATEPLGDVRNPHLMTLSSTPEGRIIKGTTSVGDNVRFSGHHRWVFQREDEGPI